MSNTSILAAFERMWQHVLAAVGRKADTNHTHSEYVNQNAFSTIITSNGSNSADSPSTSIEFRGQNGITVTTTTSVVGAGKVNIRKNSIKKLLWQNADPSSGFVTQTVPISGLQLSYDAYEIIYADQTVNTTANLYTTGEIPMVQTIGDYASYVQVKLSYNGTTITTAYPSSNGMVFNVGDRDYNVPYRIYGIKYDT